MPEPARTRPARLLYTAREAAELLSMSTRSLAGFVAAGALRYVLVGKRKRFAPSDLDTFIAARRQPQGSMAWVSTAAPTRPVLWRK